MLWETTNVWNDGGRLHHDHATHQIEEYSWANNCFFHFINNHYFSISCAQWHLSIAMHKSTSPQFVILATCHYLCLLIVVMNPWYHCIGLIKPAFLISFWLKKSGHWYRFTEMVGTKFDLLSVVVLD